MNVRKDYSGKKVPAKKSRKVAYDFGFATIDDMLAVADGNLIGYSRGGKLIVRIPADAPLPAGATETTDAVDAWETPVINNRLRHKFDDWKKKAEALRK